MSATEVFVEEEDADRQKVVMQWIREILDDDNATSKSSEEETILASLHARDPTLEMSEMQSALESSLSDLKAETLEVMSSRYGEFARVAEAASFETAFSDETAAALVELRRGVDDARETFERKRADLAEQLEQTRSSEKKEREVRAVSRFALLLEELERRDGVVRNVERSAHACMSLKAQLTGAVEFVTDGELFTRLRDLASRVDVAEKETRQAIQAEFEKTCCCLPPGGPSEDRGDPGPCLRAAAALGMGARLEAIFAAKVLEPFLEATFVASRLDGATPGSRSGLESIYAATLDYVTDRARHAVRACEAVFGGVRFKVLAVDLLANAVWDPVAAAVAAKLPGLFQHGIAGDIHKTVRATLLFVDALARALLGGSSDDDAFRNGRDRLRASDATNRLLEKWNLPVYFELVKVDTLARLDVVLEEEKKGESSSSFARATIEAIRRVWDPATCFLRPIADEALRFTFQLLEKCVDDRLLSQRYDSAKTAASVAADARLVATFVDEAVFFGGDPAAAAAEEKGLFLRAVDGEDYAKDPGDVGRRDAAVAAGVTFALRPFEAIFKEAVVALADHLAEEVSEGLRLVKSVTARYHLTNAPSPSKPSEYLKRAFKHLDDFDATWRQRLALSDDEARAFFTRHTHAVHRNYAQQVRAVLDHARKFQATLEKRRKARAGGGGENSANLLKKKNNLDLAGDAAKIAKQLAMDVDATIQRLDDFAGFNVAAFPYGAVLPQTNYRPAEAPSPSPSSPLSSSSSSSSPLLELQATLRQDDL